MSGCPFYLFIFMFSGDLCSGGWKELQIISQYLPVSYSFRCPQAEHLGWSWGRVVKGVPHNFLTLWTGQAEKESKGSELCIKRPPGRQSQCYLFGCNLWLLLCPWIWDLKFIIKILATSGVVTEFANTCTGPSHFKKPWLKNARAEIYPALYKMLFFLSWEYNLLASFPLCSFSMKRKAWEKLIGAPLTTCSVLLVLYRLRPTPCCSFSPFLGSFITCFITDKNISPYK